MHIITVSHPIKGDIVKFKISLKKSLYLFFACTVVLMILASWGTYKFSHWQAKNQKWQSLGNWELGLDDKIQYQNFKDKTEHELTLISEHIGKLSANLLRLNALGEQLIAQANLDPEEFNFSESPGMGGPLLPNFGPLEEISQTLSHLELEFNKRFQQLSFLEDFYHRHNQKKSSGLWGRGKPVKRGWVSSFYGSRTDPFTGKKAWHNGVDVAGREGDEVFALASGVVSIAQDKGTYGKLIEIKHGNGLATRYAHNKESLVKAGDLVKKGDPIALMGSTGRSTGPHVHVEVREHNKAVDPGLYFADLKRKA